jgi:nucleotide-binding universal stress UspA family protein
MLPIDQIVVPVDFSEHSRRALADAIEVAQQFGSRIHLVHASDLPEKIPLADEWCQAMKEEIARALDTYVDLAREAGVPAEIHLSDGQPWQAIVHLADEVGADLIVMGSHGRTGISHAFLGSVAERTLRTASCPVLVVKPEES